MGVATIAYALTAGADYGGGVWHLIARGRSQSAQRELIENAIAPIWEANHVWLILIIVLMFAVFPIAYAAISTALHIPITLALIGMVIRGSSFAFHAYGLRAESDRSRWGFSFGVSSTLTPVFLGMIMAALSSGQIRWIDGQLTTGFFAGWLTPFALLTGAFTLALFALLAAVYLTLEAKESLAETFRRRALAMEVVAGILAALVFWRVSLDAPGFFAGLAGSAWSIAIQLATALCATIAVVALWKRGYRYARWAVAAQVSLVIVGWGLAMDGAVVLPDLDLHNSGAREVVIRSLVFPLVAGTAVLAPSLWYLFRVFKSRG